MSSATSPGIVSGTMGASASAVLLGLPLGFGNCSELLVGATVLFERDRVNLAGAFADRVFGAAVAPAAMVELGLALPRVMGASATGCPLISSSCGSDFDSSFACVAALAGLLTGLTALFLLAAAFTEAVVTRVVPGLGSTSIFARARVTRFGGD